MSWGAREALSYIGAAVEGLQGLDTRRRGVWGTHGPGKVDELGRPSHAWLQTASHDGCPALVLPAPVTEMWKGIPRKPGCYLSCSCACLQTHRHMHAHTGTHSHTHAHTHARTPLPRAPQRSNNLRENHVDQQFRLPSLSSP